MPQRPIQPPPNSSLAALARPVKHALAAGVGSIFNDRARGEQPVVRREDGLFGRDAVAWRVHGDVASMMVGGIASLLLQMLHPAVLAGVWDHSNFRADMHGRLRRTARFIALTTYGGKAEAEAVIARVRGIHEHVRGVLPNGTPYAANEPALLAWVHVTETTSFLEAWIRYAEHGMPAADQDRYFVEMARIGEALGAGPGAAQPPAGPAAAGSDAARLTLRCPNAGRGPTGPYPARPEPAGRTRAGHDDTGRHRPAAGVGPAHAWSAQPAIRPPLGAGRHGGHRAHTALGVHLRVGRCPGPAGA